MEQIISYPYNREEINRVQASSEMDYVKDNALYKGARGSSVMVTDEGDLDDLEGYDPGAIAYTAGFGSMWQLDADGTWVEM